MPRIEEMYAFVAEDSGPDDEGVVAMSVGAVMLPLVAYKSRYTQREEI